MKQYDQNLIGIFKRYLKDNGISIKSQTGGYFELLHPNHPEKIVTAQYNCPLPVDERIHGSRNNTLIKTIARFKVEKYDIAPDFIVFPIHNPLKGKLYFALVPNKILVARIINRDHVDNSYEIVFWLMPDDHLFNCTSLSAEGEWFLLSKQAKGRMADDTDLDYTIFLNNWEVWLIK